jgi:predicted RND superfamily exporter protein
MIDVLPFSLGAGSLIAFGLAIACLRPQWIVASPKVVLSAAALISLGAVTSLIQIQPFGLAIDVDPASEPLIDPQDPGIPIYRKAVRDFGNDDVYVIVMQTEGTFVRENLEALHRLTHRLRGLTGVASVQSLARVLSVRHDPERDMVRIDQFLNRIPEDSAEIDRLERRALSDRLYRKTLISGDGLATAINLSFRPMTDAEFVELDLDGKIAALLEQESGEARRFYIAGRPHVRAQAYHMMVGDLVRLIPVGVAVAALTLWLLSGSIFGVLIPLASCLMSTLWVFGAMATLGMNVNLITLVLGSMMICIGSVYGVHVYARFEIQVEQSGPADQPALDCLLYARTPVVMAGITTCIGFAALLLADIPATNELGWFSILGVASVTMLSLTFVPSAMSLLPRPLPLLQQDGSDQTGSASSRWFDQRLEKLLKAIEHLSVERSGLVLGCWGLATVAAVFAIGSIAIDTDVITFFKKDSKVRTDFAEVNRLITGAVPIYVMVSGPGEGTFREPKNLRMIQDLQTRLEQLPGVSEVLSSVDFVRLANRAMNNGDVDQDRIPDSRAAVAEATFLLPKSELRRFSTSNHSRTNLIVRTGRAGSAAVRALEADIRTALDAAGLPSEFTTQVSGNAVLLNRSADGIARNQATQVTFAAITIFVLICGVFRSARVALIAMAPNIAPVLIFFGVLGSGIAPLSLPTSLIGSIALGVAIDDTMHFLVAYLAQKNLGRSSKQAARHCIQKVGRPIVLTSIMLVMGFSMILLSGFATLQEFGILTAFTMAVCLATDLILLPALLVRLDA